MPKIEWRSILALLSAGLLVSNGSVRSVLSRPSISDAVTTASENIAGDLKVQTLAEKAGMKALQEVNRKAMDCEARDMKKPGRKHRITFGIYFFNAPKK